MKELAIINSLIRVDEYYGALPPGFERPHRDTELAVLELGSHQEVAGWWSAARAALQTHAQFVRQVQESAGMVTLFVESAPRHPVFRLEPPGLATLAEVGVALETHHIGP